MSANLSNAFLSSFWINEKFEESDKSSWQNSVLQT